METLIPQAGKQNLNVEILFQAITFSLDNQIYAVDILNIRDIVTGKIIYRIPNSDPTLLGITNIRGEIIPVYSLKKFLGIDENTEDNLPIASIQPNEDNYLIIIKIAGQLFALVVDHIHNNIAATNKNYNEGTYMSKWSKHTIFTGVIIEENENILMIDIPSLLNILIERNK